MRRQRLHYEHQLGTCPAGYTCPGHQAPATADTLNALDHLRTAGRLAYVGPAMDPPLALAAVAVIGAVATVAAIAAAPVAILGWAVSSDPIAYTALVVDAVALPLLMVTRIAQWRTNRAR